MPLLLMALLAAPPQDPAAARDRGTTIHGLVMPVPSTWTRKEDSGVVYLTPPQIQSSLPYLLLVFPPNKLQVGHWEAHKTMVKALLAQAAWTGGEPVLVHKADGPGPFIKTEAAGRTAAGEGRTFTLFTAAHDGIMEAVFGVNAIDRNVVDPVLKATTFKDPPKADARPKIVEAYRRLNQRLYNTRDGGALVAGNLQYDRLWLRSDGTADFSSFYFEGYAASPLVLKTGPGLLNGEYGSWKEVDGKLQLLRTAGGTVEAGERKDGGLRAFGKDWEPMPRVDGLKLSGRWELKTADTHHWIDFTPEGTFKTDGLLRCVGAHDIDLPKPPEKGAGRYEIRDWTMFFTFDGGTAWSCDFSILGREPAADASILFRTASFPKAK